MAKGRRNPLRIDPSRTGLLRRAYLAEVHRRFERLRRLVLQLVLEEDAFGLKPDKPLSFNYDPSQPREPAGTSEGGQWTAEGFVGTPLKKLRPDRSGVWSGVVFRAEGTDLGGTSQGPGMYVTPQKGVARQYGRNVRKYIFKGLKVLGLTSPEYQKVRSGLPSQGASKAEIAAAAKKAGWDALYAGPVEGMVIWKVGGPVHNLTANAPRQVWRFETDDAKLRQFNQWFQQQVRQGILEVDAGGTRPWTAKYVESSYKKGLLRAYMDVHRSSLAPSMDFYRGGERQFLQSSFGGPEAVSKLRLLYTRSYEELKGISAAMSQQISRVMADGIAHGKHPTEMARTMSKTITGIERTRANVLARTEVIHTHAEGQLDGFEDLGVEEVGVLAEWETANDDDVCELCAELEGTVMSISEARGLIPRHPNCRCCWIPANVGERKTGRAWTKRQKSRRVEASIRAERPNVGLAAARAGSAWAGKEKRFRTTPIENYDPNQPRAPAGTSEGG